MTHRRPTEDIDALTGRLRTAGCVFAEDEAAALVRACPDALRRELLVRRRERGEPLEHLLGAVEFGTLRLAVGPGAFVPRQRSLLLAQLAVHHARRHPAPVLLEACAGVAPIASAAARTVPRLETHASDVDPLALSYARRNLPKSAGVHHGHLLDATPATLRGRVTVLAAVPPYVPAAAAPLLPREARDHEPALALYGGHDGLDHVRGLLDTAQDWLAPSGRVLLELNTRQQHDAVAHAARAGLRRHQQHHGEDGQTVVLELTAD